MYNFTTVEQAYYDALIEGVDDIKAHPSHWNQAQWHCGTSHCLSGFCDVRANTAIGKPLDFTYEAFESPFGSAYPVFGKAALIFRAENTLNQIEYLLRVIGIHGFSFDATTLPDYYGAYGYDRNGYDCNGYHADGYDADGYDADGYDCTGYDADGYDRNGYDCNGYHADGYDADGYGKNDQDRPE